MKKNRQEGATARLAQYAVDLKYEDLPENVIHAAKRCLLDWLGVALGGSTHRGVDMLLEVAKTIGTQPKASIIGRRERTDLLHAALVNGFMSHVLDYDDTDVESYVHPSSPLWPAISALSEMQPVSGKQAIMAFVLGYEVENRIGHGINRYHDERGWHMTAMVGGFGAAAAAGKLLHFDGEQMCRAFGIAATSSSGLREMFGTLCKPFHPGKASMSGLYAALLARAGFTSSQSVLEAQRGFFFVNAGTTDTERVVLGLGEGFEILNDSIKPYSCGSVTHPAIEAVINLRNRQTIDPESVLKIEAEVHPIVLEVTDRPTPQTGLKGKFSIYHCLAAALVDGRCGPDQFTDKKVHDPVIQSMRAIASASANPDFRYEEARVRLTLKEGEILEEHVPFVSGTPTNPLSDDQLMSKYSPLAVKVLGSHGAKNLAERVWNLDEVDSFQNLLMMTTPAIA